MLELKEVAETTVHKLRRRYNPEIGHRLSQRLLSGVTEQEAESWFKHPCTQALVASLEGDLAGLVSIWLGGGYASEDSSDATAQLQSKARGMAQAYEDMIETITEIRAKETKDESNGV